METLPDKVGNTLPATLDIPSDPIELLDWDDDRLRKLASDVGVQGGPIMERVRKVAGLTAWAAWHRHDDAEYKAVVDDMAAKLFVTERTIRNWRDALTKGKNALPAPGKALARQAEAEERLRKAREAKAAGQTPGVETVSTDLAPKNVVLQATAKEVIRAAAAADSAQSVSSAGAPSGPTDTGGTRDAKPRSATDGEAETTSDGRGDELADGVTPQGTPTVNPPDEVPGSPDPAFQRPLNPPEMVAEVDVDAIGLRWLKSKTDVQVRAIGDPWGPAIRSEIGRWQNAYGRSPGHKITPENRAKAKAEADKSTPTISAPITRAAFIPHAAPTLTRRQVEPQWKVGKK